MVKRYGTESTPYVLYVEYKAVVAERDEARAECDALRRLLALAEKPKPAWYDEWEAREKKTDPAWEGYVIRRVFP